MEDNLVGFTTLTKKQESFNSALYKLCVYVKMPFGEAQMIFSLLGEYWCESENQLNCLVWIAVEVQSMKK